MEPAGNLFANFDIEIIGTETSRNSRNSLIKKLYELYLSQPAETKKENQRRYHDWVRIRHPEVCKKHGFSKERYGSYKGEFKKSRLPPLERYIPTFSVRFFAIRMSHLKGDEGRETLEYMISVATDILNRKGNVASYILGSIKAI